MFPLENIFYSQSFLNFRGALISSRRYSKTSLFSFQSQIQDLSSENEFADDEYSIFEENRSGSGSMSHHLHDRHSSSLSECLFLPPLLLQPDGLKHSSIGCNGCMSQKDRSSPPVGFLLSKVALDKTFSQENVRNALRFPNSCGHFVIIIIHITCSTLLQTAKNVCKNVFSFFYCLSNIPGMT